jgi:hypothetical protein
MSAWRESVLTRARELRALSDWAKERGVVEPVESLSVALKDHLQAAEKAASERVRLTGHGSTIQRAAGNLDAAEADLLQYAPAEYILNQMPSLLNHVQRHLSENDPRRNSFEAIAEAVNPNDVSVTARGLDRMSAGDEVGASELEARWCRKIKMVQRQRGLIVGVVRAASSEALREKMRIASFRNALGAAAAVMTLLAGGIAILGYLNPPVIAMCFEPQDSGRTVIVCPTSRSEVLNENGQSISGDPTPKQVDDTIQATAKARDLLVVETIGFTAASVAAAAAIRNMRGSSEPYGLPIALALLKMPTGAITAFLGLLLIRGGFVPGLSALDTPAQIVAWAIVFGYAQQLFTRYLDQQADAVLGSVRGGDVARGVKVSRRTDGKRDTGSSSGTESRTGRA